MAVVALSAPCVQLPKLVWLKSSFPSPPFFHAGGGGVSVAGRDTASTFSPLGVCACALKAYASVRARSKRVNLVFCITKLLIIKLNMLFLT